MVNQRKNETVLAFYKGLGLTEPAMVNEMLRFRALEQLMAASPRVKEWGLSVDEMYALAEQATTEAFGPIAISKEQFGSAYQQAFAVDVFQFLNDMGLMDGIRGGIDMEPLMNHLLDQLAEAPEIPGVTRKMLFVHVEEYASFIEPILQRFGVENVVFQAETKEANAVLRCLYPKADIIVDMPAEGHFTDLVFIHRGYFEDSTKALIEASFAIGGELLHPMGHAHFIIDSRAFYEDPEQNELWKEFFETNGFANEQWAQIFYEHPGLSRISEWLPLEVYHLEFGPKEVDKAELRFLEIDGDAVIEKNLIPLHKRHMVTLPHFSLVEYALVCGGYDPDMETEEESVAYAWSLEGDETAPWRHTWTMNPVDAALWALFLETKRGQQLQEILHTYADTEAGYAQLMLGLRRPVLDEKTVEEMVVGYWEGVTAYETAVEQANADWDMRRAKLGELFGC